MAWNSTARVRGWCGVVPAGGVPGCWNKNCGQRGLRNCGEAKPMEMAETPMDLLNVLQSRSCPVKLAPGTRCSLELRREFDQVLSEPPCVCPRQVRAAPSTAVQRLRRVGCACHVQHNPARHRLEYATTPALPTSGVSASSTSNAPSRSSINPFIPFAGCSSGNTAHGSGEAAKVPGQFIRARQGVLGAEVSGADSEGILYCFGSCCSDSECC